MSASVAIRPARPEDAVECATILNDWIDETLWMPRVHSKKDVERHYSEFVFKNRKVTVAGEQSPVGYIALDEEEGFITSLFLKAGARGGGVGKRLLAVAKSEVEQLQLWTFVANTGAQRFYEREGFVEADRSDADNEEGLSDIFYRWRA